MGIYVRDTVFSHFYFSQTHQQRRLTWNSSPSSLQIHACHRGLLLWKTDLDNSVGKKHFMIFHTRHVFISSSLPLPTQGFCRSSKRLLTCNMKSRAASVMALRVVVYIPSPKLFSSYYPYFILDTVSLLFLAFQAVFLDRPPSPTSQDSSRDSSLPCVKQWLKWVCNLQFFFLHRWLETPQKQHQNKDNSNSHWGYCIGQKPSYAQIYFAFICEYICKINTHTLAQQNIAFPQHS